MTIICSDPVSSPWLAAPPTSRDRRIALADDLNAEWRRLGRDRELLTQIAGWRLPGGRPTHLDEVLAWAGYLQPVDDVAGDRVLARLVRRAACDPLAARIVLQRILPGLIRTAIRRAPIVAGGGSAAFGDLVSSAWVTIRTFPIIRRPHRVAANLLRDVEYQTFVRSARRTQREECPGDLEATYAELVADPRATETGERFQWEELLAWAQCRGISREQFDVVRRSAMGQSSTEIAALWSCTERNVRYRRVAAVTALRRAYTDDAA